MAQSVAEKIGHGVEHAVDEVCHDLRQVRGQLGARAQDTALAIHDLAAEARDRTRAVTKTVARTARARPIATAAVVAGVAAVLGFLIGRVAPRKP